MKKITWIALLVTAILCQPVFAQRKNKGNGNIVKIAYQMPPFTGINARATDNIVITAHGTPYSVTIQTDENIQDKIKMKVKNRLLTFSYANIRPNKLKFYLSVPSLKVIKASGASDVKTADTLKIQKLKITASGATDVKLNLQGEEIRVDASGASDVRLTGKTRTLYADCSGAADLKAGDLLVDTVYAKASGASTLHVNPVKYLNKQVSGAAGIKLSSNHHHVVSIQSSENPEKLLIYNNEEIGGIPSDTTTVKIGSINLRVVDGDTTKVRLGNHELVVNEDGNVKWGRCTPPFFNGHWGGVELGINGYVTPRFDTDFGKAYNPLSLQYEKSLTVNLNLYEQNFALNRTQTVGFITGLGLSINNYRFSQPTYLSPDSINLSAFTMSNVNVRKSKLTAAYVTIPLLLEIQTNKFKHGKHFHFTVGAIVNARISSHTKIYFNEANKQYRLEDPATGLPSFTYYVTPNRTDRNTIKSYNSFSLTPFRVDATARIGYGPVNFFATYALTPMFQKNRGPEVYQWTAGITLIGW